MLLKEEQVIILRLMYRAQQATIPSVQYLQSRINWQMCMRHQKDDSGSRAAGVPDIWAKEKAYVANYYTSLKQTV